MWILKKILYYYTTLPVVIFRRFIKRKQEWATIISNNLSISGFYYRQKDIDFIINNKINLIINFADELYLNNSFKKQLFKYNIEFITFKVKDRTPISLNVLETWYEIVKKNIDNGYKIHINCAMWQSRSAMFLAFILLKLDSNQLLYNNDIDLVLKEIKNKREQVYLHKNQYNMLKSYFK